MDRNTWTDSRVSERCYATLYLSAAQSKLHQHTSANSAPGRRRQNYLTNPSLVSCAGVVEQQMALVSWTSSCVYEWCRNRCTSEIKTQITSRASHRSAHSNLLVESSSVNVQRPNLWPAHMTSNGSCSRNISQSASSLMSTKFRHLKVNKEDNSEAVLHQFLYSGQDGHLHKSFLNPHQLFNKVISQDNINQNCCCREL